MGKSLIIKDADFSANSFDNISGLTDISSNIVRSGTGRQYIHYPNNNQTYQFGYVSSISSRICTLDVSNYVGRKILAKIHGIRSSSNFTGGAWWICFASAVSVQLPWTGTKSVNDVVTVVENVNGKSATVSDTDWYELTVPSGAEYFITRDYASYPLEVYLSDE